MAAASQDAFCTVSQSISFLHPWISLLRDTALTFCSCSQAIHTYPVRMSTLFNRFNTEKMCQVPWCLHIPYETTVLGSYWLFSSPSTLYRPRHSRNSRYTSDFSVEKPANSTLQTIYDHIIPVDRITNKSPQNLYLMNRPDLVSTFTKIALWRQSQFHHIVYIDADVVSLRAPDELFNNPPNFAAVPDIGWPDCFNSGVLSLKPNMGDYYALLALAQRGISFDGADQGLLNMHFRDWQRLSFTYNCTPSGNYQYVPAYRHFQSQINLVHYIGNEKPWLIGREQKRTSGVYEELLGRWWAVYDKHYMTPVSRSGHTSYYPAHELHQTTVYISGQAQKQSRTVQQYVKGETSSTDYGFSSVQPQDDELEEPEAPIHTTEPSLTDKTDLAEDIQQGEVTPMPTAQQRRFSIDWDPIR